MTRAEKNGRTKLLLLIAATLFFSAGTIVLYVAAKGTGRLPVQIGRFVLTTGLMWWLYRGSPAAKWIVIVLYGSTGFFGLSTILFGNRLLSTVGVKMGMLYLSFVSLLVTSSDIRAFLDFQRGVIRWTDFDRPADEPLAEDDESGDEPE